MNKLIQLTLFLFITLPSMAQTVFEKGKLLFDSKKYEEASTFFKSIKEKDRDYGEARFYLGRISFEKKEYDDAADYFDEAIEANDKVSDYYNWLGNTYGTIAADANPFKQGILAPKMKNAWEKAIALDPKNLDARFSLIQFYLQAPGFMGGSKDKAKEMARQITAISPVQGHRSMGNIYVNEKNFKEAEKEYLEMVKVDAAYRTVLANFYVNQSQYEKAFALYEDVLKKDPSDMGAIYQMGRTSALSGQRLDQGEEYLKKYLQYTPKPNEPSHAGANMRLGQIYEKRGQKQEARKYFETAYKMDNKLKEAEEGIKRTSK